MAASGSHYVKITSYSVHPVNKNVEYTIHFGNNGEPIRRRFREFVQLREDLKKYWSDIPDLPSQIFDTSPRSRSPKLEWFLNQVCETLGASPPKQLLTFFAIDENNFKRVRSKLSGNLTKYRVDIGQPKIPERYKDQIDRISNEVVKYSTISIGEAGWKLVGQSGNFTWLARAAHDGQRANRMVFGKLKRCPPRLVHELFLDNKACMEMEANIDSIVDVERLDEHTLIQYVVMKSIMYMPPRDVILLRHWRVLPDGKIVHAEFSLEEYAGVPQSATGGKIRASLTCGGAVIVPFENDLTACKVWRINDMDPKLGDSIPDWALVKINEFTASMLSKNMFSLAKLVTERSLPSELAKGPLVNWNGKVEGSQDAGLAISTISISQPVQGLHERPFTKARLVHIQDLKPYLTGFALGIIVAFALQVLLFYQDRCLMSKLIDSYI